MEEFEDRVNVSTTLCHRCDIVPAEGMMPSLSLKFGRDDDRDKGASIAVPKLTVAFIFRSTSEFKCTMPFLDLQRGVHSGYSTSMLGTPSASRSVLRMR